MKKIGIAIISVVIIIIILLISIVLVLNGKKDDDLHTDLVDNNINTIVESTLQENNSTNNETINPTITETQTQAEIISNANIDIEEYYRVMYGIRYFLEILSKDYYMYYTNPETGEETNNYYDIIQKHYIHNVLSTGFTQKNGITEENVLTKVNPLDEKLECYPIEIINILNGDNIKTYKVKTITQNSKTENKSVKYFIIHITTDKKLFAVEPIEEEAYGKSKFEEISKIETNDNNQFREIKITKQNVVLEVFNNFKNITLAQPKYTYDKMTEEYKNARFGSYETYEKYVKDSYELLSKISPKKYLEEDAEKQNQYIIKDQYDNTYTFEIITPLNYTVMLDTYTIESEQTKTSYKSIREDKIPYMNVKRFFEMINNKDYKTAIKYLPDSFKNSSKISNEKDLETIAKNTFLPYNKLEILAEKIGENNTFLYKLKLTDLLGESNATKEVTVQVNQIEGSKFTIQFK